MEHVGALFERDNLVQNLVFRQTDRTLRSLLYLLVGLTQDLSAALLELL